MNGKKDNESFSRESSPITLEDLYQNRFNQPYSVSDKEKGVPLQPSPAIVAQKYRDAMKRPGMISSK